MFKLTKIALAAGLATSAFTFSASAPAEARGAFSLNVPGLSLQVGPRYHHRRHYNRSYYNEPRYYRWKRHHKRHRKHYRHNRRHHRYYNWR